MRVKRGNLPHLTRKWDSACEMGFKPISYQILI